MGKRRIIVVGGGPAGLMAAGRAAENGASTILLEKMNFPGRKLLITGHSRCNLTNDSPLDEFIEKFGSNGQFLRQAFSQFFAPDLIKFVARLGVKVRTETDRRVFPESERASDIVNALVGWVNKCGVVVRNLLPVKQLLIEKGRIAGVEVSAESQRKNEGSKRVAFGSQMHIADAVIIATGGASYPSTGSTGDGYRLAQKAGHHIVPIRPALVPVETQGNIASRLQGLSLKEVAIRLVLDGEMQVDRARHCGEIVFTHFGLSGPLILSLSKRVVDSLKMGHKVHLSIDLAPSLNDSDLDDYIIRQIRAHGKQGLNSLLIELLPRKLISICMELGAISPTKIGSQLTASERQRLITLLKDFRLDVTGFRPFTEAIITAGGVDIREINPRTMESRLVKKLYFAGEVLDLDGDSGGYNLQAAFSTGWVAGNSAAGAGD
ncbi:MAG: aminoacetone oxidase family FAD-binding enzyme [candidate division Zixibacteria bacterium CG_4_9_14_3_um_filter_46_8]|nr:MAG: aminoacetone oxidase family FAD-binding enzyme [candidate division Zixibacteria bacterium CG_4_9_14_3_um_filter_46_8]